MARFENIIPLPEADKIKSILEKNNVDGVNSLEPSDVYWLKTLNGTVSLKESFDIIYKKGYPADFKNKMSLFLQLVDKKAFKNADSLRTAINQWHALNAGSWVSQSSVKVDKNHFTKDNLIPLIQKTTLFHACERQKAELVLNVSSLKYYLAGDTIVKKGAVGPYFYILLQGEVGVIFPKLDKLELVATLSPLSIFGESAAMFNQPRNADVRALEEVCVLEVDAKKLVTKDNSKFFDDFKSIKSRLIINQLLAANPLFKGIPADLLQLFLKNCRLEKHPKENFIIKQGDDSKTFYFILKGSVAIVKDDLPVRSLAEGHFFGEVATLLNEKRTASVICEEDTLILAINGDRFIDVLSRNLNLALKVEDEALTRLSSSYNIFTPQNSNDIWTDDQTTTILQTLSGVKMDDSFFESSATQLDIEYLDFSTQKGES